MGTAANHIESAASIRLETSNALLKPDQTEETRKESSAVHPEIPVQVTGGTGSEGNHFKRKIYERTD
jgi:FlaA1/EpsC-like NDP-sugar epimerase